jgi:transposase
MNIKKWVDKTTPLVQDRMQWQTLLNIFTRKSRREISWLSDPEEGLGCPRGQLIEYHLTDMKDKFITLRNFYAMKKTCGGV